MDLDQLDLGSAGGEYGILNRRRSAPEQCEEMQDNSKNNCFNDDDFEDIQFFHQHRQHQQMSNVGDGCESEQLDLHGSSGIQFQFPDNMEANQFFPGSCTGYLETILEEDDNFEDSEQDEESGRNWWDPNSDTDTESVIRLDNQNDSKNGQQDSQISKQQQPQATNAFPHFLPTAQSNQFRLTASSRPFELEDRHLLDQLDLAFEETLLEPRRRTGFAIDQELNFLADEPKVVNEDDFFYSSSESSDDEKNGGSRVLAEFSLNPPNNNRNLNLNLNMLSSDSDNLFNTSNLNRRSFEISQQNNNKIKSFRSFDSLNILSGNELLFGVGKASSSETYPHPDSTESEIEQNEKSSPTSISPSDHTSCSSSGGIQSTENLSEDSGIGDSHNSHLGKTEFALNPFLYSSPEVSFTSGNYFTSGSGSSTTSSGKNSGKNSLEDVEEVDEETDSTSTSVSGVISQTLKSSHALAEDLNGNIKRASESSSPFITSSKDELKNVQQVHIEKDPSESVPRSPTKSPIYPINKSSNNSLISELALDSPSTSTYTCTTSTTTSASNINRDRIGIQKSSISSVIENESTDIKSICADSIEPNGNIISTADTDNMFIRGQPSMMSDAVESHNNQLDQKPVSVINEHQQATLQSPLSLQEKDISPSTSSTSNTCSPLFSSSISGNFKNNSISSRTSVPVLPLCPEVVKLLREGKNQPVQVQILPDVLSYEKLTETTAEKMDLEQNNSSSSPLVKTKTITYGEKGNEIEVFVIKSNQNQNRTPSPILKSPNSSSSPLQFPPPPLVVDTNYQAGGEYLENSENFKNTKTRVHFSPVVSEIQWRESYTDQGSGSEELSDSSGQHDEDSGGDDGEMVKNGHIAPKAQDEDFNCVNGRTKLGKERVNVHVSNMPETQRISESTEVQVNNPKYNNTLSMVPDLLSQCENLQANSDTQIDIMIGEQQQILQNQQHEFKMNLNNEPPTPTKQIFPTVFSLSDNTKDSKSANKKSSSKSFTLPLTSKDRQQRTNSNGNNGTKTVELSQKTQTLPNNPTQAQALSKDKDSSKKKDKKVKEPKESGGTSKPGFFERLTKIRLSGGSKSKKLKITDDKNDNTGSTKGKNSQNEMMEIEQIPKLPTSKPPSVQRPSDEPPPRPLSPQEHDEIDHQSSIAFNNILDQIAGINTIKARQESNAKSKLRSFAERKQFFKSPNKSSEADVGSPNKSNENVSTTTSTSPSRPAEFNLSLETKLNQFRDETSKNREFLAQSQPDPKDIQNAVKNSIHVTMTVSPEPDKLKISSNASPIVTTESHQKQNEREWHRLLKTAAEKYYRPTSRANKPSGIVETDLDTGKSREMLESDFMENAPVLRSPTSPNGTSSAKAKSLTNLSSELRLSLPPQKDLLSPSGDLCDPASDERAKSLEFLLDENNKNNSVAPENNLQKEQQQQRQLSEHELRIQKSLQNLNIPTWYKQNAQTQDSQQKPEAKKSEEILSRSRLNRRNEFGSGSGLAGGWTGLSGYKTTSLSSLSNARLCSGSLSLNRSNFVRGRFQTRSSRESLLSPSSLASQSPTGFERCSFTYGMPLNTMSSGTASPSGTMTPTNSYDKFSKKVYLGWRSNEKLNSLPLSVYKPPEERAANELINLRLLQQKKSRPGLPIPPKRSENTTLTSKSQAQIQTENVLIHNNQENSSTISNSTPNSKREQIEQNKFVHQSIIELGKSINDFVTGKKSSTPPPQTSNDTNSQVLKPANKKPKVAKKPLVWIESSFVGKKPPSAPKKDEHF